jgi:hypothetical protein
VTGPTGQNKAVAAALFSSSGFSCIRPGGVAVVQGKLACVQGELFVFSSFGLVVCTLCLSIVLSQMCQAVALA